MPSATPRPGSPVRGSKSGKPIMALFDLLGRSWALGIVWQLSERAMTFREVQGACETVSPTVLNKRLKELRECGLIERGDSGYQLTDLGRELFTLLHPFGDWAYRWAEAVANQPSDAPWPPLN